MYTTRRLLSKPTWVLGVGEATSSISSNSGNVDHDVLAELLVSGLEAFEDGCELLSDDVSDEELSVPLVLVLSVLELPDRELGKDTED